MHFLFEENKLILKNITLFQRYHNWFSVLLKTILYPIANSQIMNEAYREITPRIYYMIKPPRSDAASGTIVEIFIHGLSSSFLLRLNLVSFEMEPAACRQLSASHHIIRAHQPHIFAGGGTLIFRMALQETLLRGIAPMMLITVLFGNDYALAW